MCKKRQHSISNEVDCCFMASDQKQENHGEHLVSAHPVTRLFSLDHSCSKVIFWAGLSQPDQPANITQERDHAGNGLQGAEFGRLGRHNRVRPTMEFILLSLWDTQHL